MHVKKILDSSRVRKIQGSFSWIILSGLRQWKSIEAVLYTCVTVIS